MFVTTKSGKSTRTVYVPAFSGRYMDQESQTLRHLLSLLPRIKTLTCEHYETDSDFDALKDEDSSWSLEPVAPLMALSTLVNLTHVSMFCASHSLTRYTSCFRLPNLQHLKLSGTRILWVSD